MDLPCFIQLENNVNPSLSTMKPVLAMVLAGALLACNGAGEPPPVDASPAATTPAASSPAPGQPEPAPASEGASALESYAWQLTNASDGRGAPIAALQAADSLQLAFKGGELSVRGGCNHIGGSYALEGRTLRAGALRQTQMACADSARMAADAAIVALLANPLQMTLAEIDQPRLTLVATNGDTVVFTGTPTPQARFGGEGTTVFFEVGPQRVPCPHPLIRDMQCLQVRERVYADDGTLSSQGEWQPLYQEIEGYTHAPGTRNVLRLKRFAVKNPPADASAVAYVLDMVIESEIVDGAK